MNSIAGPSRRIALPRRLPPSRPASSSTAQVARPPPPPAPSPPAARKPPLDKPFRPAQRSVLFKAARPPPESPTAVDSATLNARARNVQVLTPEVEAFLALGATAELSDDYDGIDDATLKALTPGSFVELRRVDRSMYGVVLGYQLQGGEALIRTMTANGTMMSQKPGDVFFTVPSYFPHELVNSCGLRPDPANESEARARVVVLRRLRELMREIEQSENRIQTRAAMLYDSFRSKDATVWGKLSAVDAARFVDRTNPDDTPSSRTVIAVHRYMYTRPIYFVGDSTLHRVNQEFALRPWADVSVINTVNAWTKRADPVLDAFVAKARAVIPLGRTRRRTGAVEPFRPPGLPEWSESDRTIIAFLKIHSSRWRFTQEQPTLMSVNPIVKKIGLYPRAEISRFTVVDILRDIGVYTPWQNPGALQAETHEAHEKVVYREEKYAEALLEKHARQPPPAGAVLGPEDFLPADPCDAIRHDFGALPVYVVDDPDAQELDDGLSVERIPGPSGDAWVHVHIADPTALLHPAHVIAKEAAKRATTVYMADRTYRMLPAAISHSGLSLADTTATGEKQGSAATIRTMTFSARVDKEGNLVETKVRPGLIRKVKVLSYDVADALLGTSDPQFRLEPIFRWEKTLDPAAVQRARDGDAHILPDLQLLQRLTRAMCARRTRGTYQISFHNAQVRLRADRGVPTEGAEDAPAPQFFHGFPRIDLGLDSLFQVGAKGIVSEAMVMAGRVAARFCGARGIPVLYRGMERPLAPTPTALEEALALREEPGMVDRAHALRLGLVFLPGTTGLSPLAHFSLGLGTDEGYLRVTSPLRRYMDMVTHWQLKSALLHPQQPLKKLAFSRAEVERLIPTVRMEVVRGRTEKNDTAFWAGAKIKHVLETDADPRARQEMMDMPALLRTAHANMRTRARGELKVYLPRLGVDALLELRSPMHPWKCGDTVRVRLSEVKIQSGSLITVAPLES